MSGEEERHVVSPVRVEASQCLDHALCDRIEEPAVVVPLVDHRHLEGAASRFDRPGIVRVFCDIHSHMNAFILVFSHPFFGMTDADSRYRIENVPPGTYGVIAWNEGVSSEAKPITVPDGGVAELDFTLR